MQLEQYADRNCFTLFFIERKLYRLVTMETAVAMETKMLTGCHGANSSEDSCLGYRDRKLYTMATIETKALVAMETKKC